jgi:hypothetical protein
MLLPDSRAIVGITEGRGMKLGMGFPINPLDDSDVGIRRYLYVTSEKGDPFDAGIGLPTGPILPRP